MTRVHRLICGGSTGSRTRSSDDMVSRCRVGLRKGGRERGREGGVVEQSHQYASVAPSQSFLIRPNTQQPCGSLAATVGLVMLCCHEILMVKEAKE